jgi:hypothetical protein
VAAHSLIEVRKKEEEDEKNLGAFLVQWAPLSFCFSNNCGGRGGKENR